MQGITGKVAIVTGATDGIGETVAETLFAAGAKVVIASRDREKTEAKAKAMDSTGKSVLGLECDVADPAAVESLVQKTVKHFGGLHLAVNNAGITGPAGMSIAEQSIEDWNEVIAVTLSGVFHCMKFEIPAMLNGGGGSIVNLSSANGVVGITGLAPYTAAKHGVLGLTRAAALEYAQAGVRVNAVGPGYVDTPRMRLSPPEFLEGLAHAHPMGRLAKRDEIARFIMFLLSAESAFCTGGFYPVDGGYTAQ